MRARCGQETRAERGNPRQPLGQELNVQFYGRYLLRNLEHQRLAPVRRIAIGGTFSWLLLCLSVWGLAGCGPPPEPAGEGPEAGSKADTTKRIPRQEPFVERPFQPLESDSWKSRAVSYGPFRDGQQPGGPWPSKDEIREDLLILAKHFDVLRVYGSDQFVWQACEVIREEGLPLKLMVGAWIETETQGPVEDPYEIPTSLAANARQVGRAIELANEFPEIVAAITVGNETQVSWSFHAVRAYRLLQYVRQVRSATTVPVSVADDFMFWTSQDSLAVAREIDFIVTHIYAMWHAQPLDQAVAFTQEKLAEVQAMHPGKQVVIGETGWATAKAGSGDQSERLLGAAGESEQQQFYQTLMEWAGRDGIAVFFFEAFDETWKGGSDPADAEKHWGLFRADRTPKSAFQQTNTPANAEG